MRDVAIVSFATSGSLPAVEDTETQMLFPVISEAIERSGIPRADIGFTCSGSADYLAGTPFAFVGNLEAVGAWPPISESHVDMDGAWALYEAWVRLQHGDVDVALAFSSGISSRSDLREVLCLQNDPYYVMPLWADHGSLAGLQARAAADAGLIPEADASVGTPPASDGAAAVILVAGDRAREVCERPAWIRGIEHRTDPHYLGVRDLAEVPSARLAAEAAGLGDAPVEVAQLSAAHPHEEVLLRRALGLGDEVEVHTGADPLMVSGLVHIGEAFRQINENGRRRTVGHASSGACLQQNLVCVLEGDA
ncbi:MAG TPA: lipid-transfer protein [Iamia sp.]|nr:lipid-transfer protein [Iamia sp.]